MSQIAKAREWFAANASGGQFRTRNEFRDALGLTTAKARELVGSMRQLGSIVSDGTHHGCGYRTANPGERIRPVRTPKQIAARKIASQAYERARSVRRWAEGAEARASRPKRAPIPKFKPIAVPRMRLVASQPAKPAPVPAETVAEWMARTGGQPEVLEIGQVSKPLQFIGFRAFNNPQRVAA